MLKLEPKQILLFELLFRSVGYFIPTNIIHESIWGKAFEWRRELIINCQMCRLRRTLREQGSLHRIETQRDGQGGKFRLVLDHPIPAPVAKTGKARVPRPIAA